jgi:hypothetical protein
MRIPLLAMLPLAASLSLVASPIVVAQQPTAPPAPPVQPSYSDDSVAVMGVLQRLFAGMRARDTALMRAQFHAAAPMRSVRWRPEAEGPRAMIDEENVTDWLAGVASAPLDQQLDERLGPPVVRVDGNLALVWVYYEFWLGDSFSNCGADQFTLGRTNGGWVVMFVADSKRRATCTPNLPRGS